MQTHSRSLLITLLGAVSIHAAGFALAWKLNNNEKIVNLSVAGSKIVLLNKKTPAKPKIEETTQLEPFTPTHVAQFEPDSVADIVPAPVKPKEVPVEIPAETPLEIKETVKKVIAKKVSHDAELKIAPKPIIKEKAIKPKEKTVAKKEQPPQKINPLIQPKENVEEVTTPRVLASAPAATNIKKSATNSAQQNTVSATNSALQAEKNYYSELGSWLAKHKKYPRRARLRKQEGAALLYFVVDHNGRVLKHHVEESSGHRLLDKEVTAMLKRAEPLPKIPDILRQAKLEITVPVEFFLR